MNKNMGMILLFLPVHISVSCTVPSFSRRQNSTIFFMSWEVPTLFNLSEVRENSKDDLVFHTVAYVTTLHTAWTGLELTNSNEVK